MKRISVFCLLYLLIISILCLTGYKKKEVQSIGKDPKRGYDIVCPTLSPDNKKVMLVVCHEDTSCNHSNGESKGYGFGPEHEKIARRGAS